MLLAATTHLCIAQNIRQSKIWNPANDQASAVNGQGWHTGLKNYYDRFPAKAATSVRTDVWKLSRNSAGLYLRFKSDAPGMIVRYGTSGSIQMPNMAATGVSGLDLYAKGADGHWVWAAGKYTYGDTIVCRFTNLKTADHSVPEYTLYLPLYNSVNWMEIIVPEQSTLTPIPASVQKPIVVYGTSIAQGASASRPGLAWTSILGRKLDRPVVNLGFSGNGQLEKEVCELLSEIDASLYVLDCLPNLTRPEYTNEEIINRVEATVAHLQLKRPGVPILLTEHDGHMDDGLNPNARKAYERVNFALNTAFAKLKEKGVKQVYLLSKAAINQDIESTVDGTHPNDIGMMHYAEAYEKAIRKIK